MLLTVELDQDPPRREGEVCSESALVDQRWVSPLRLQIS